LYKKTSKTVVYVFIPTILTIVVALFFQELYQLVTVYSRTRVNQGNYLLSKETNSAVEIPILIENTREDLVINQTTLLVSFLKF
jgi:hypothetical protein